MVTKDASKSIHDMVKMTLFMCEKIQYYLNYRSSVNTFDLRKCATISHNDANMFCDERSSTS